MLPVVSSISRITRVRHQRQSYRLPIGQITGSPIRPDEDEDGGRRHFSSLLSSPVASPALTKQQDMSNTTRKYHATNRQEIILPFLPEMVLFVVVAGGWTLYRTSQGKPLTPDEALKAQEDFRRRQEELRERQWKYDRQRVRE